MSGTALASMGPTGGSTGRRTCPSSPGGPAWAAPPQVARALRANDHPGAGGGSGGLVDEDEAARRPVTPVLVEEQRLSRAQPDPADLVEPELRHPLPAVQRRHVDL